MAINFSSKQLRRAQINFYGALYAIDSKPLKFILRILKMFKIRMVNYTNYILRSKIKFFLRPKKISNSRINFKHLSDDLISKCSSYR